MKLSEYKDERALEVIADLIEPVAAICADKAVLTAFKRSRANGIKELIKAHKGDVMAVLAALEGVPVEDYHCTLLTLPMKILDIINDPDIMSLFTFAEQTEDGKPSGSASANTEE